MLAETCNARLHEGRQVMVIGRVAISAYAGLDGKVHAGLEVTAELVRFQAAR